MSTLIVGDIHGCWDEFRELLDLASIGKGDRIIALGDIVDRGPDSAALLEFFRSQPHAESLQGNHERKHFRSFRGELKPALSQTLAREQIGEQAYPGACEFMASLPEFIELPNALLVHGFFEPGVPVREQRTTVIVGTLSGEFRLQRNYDHPWYELYDGELPIIAGHRDYLLTGRPLVHLGRVFGIDTGCCKGGRLTGLLLPEFRFVSVAARKDYWAEASVSRRNCGPADRRSRKPRKPRPSVSPAAPPRLVRGRHLVECGMTPGPGFGPILQECYDAQLAGKISTLAEGIDMVRARVRPTSESTERGM